MEEVPLQREEYLSLNIKYTCSWCNKFVVYIYIYIYTYIYRSKPSTSQTLSEVDGKICQNIKPPTPTHIPSSVKLSTWRRLED